jgi:PmbA protein
MYSDEASVHTLLQKVLSYSQAEQTEVAYLGTESALTRFATNHIHQNVAESNAELRVRAVVGQRIGVAATNRLDDESLRRVTEQALEIARVQPVNPEFHSLPAPQPISVAPGYSERTAQFTPEERARQVLLLGLQRSVDWSPLAHSLPRFTLEQSRTRWVFLPMSHVPRPSVMPL